MKFPTIEDYKPIDYNFSGEDWKFVSQQGEWYPKGIKCYVLSMFLQVIAAVSGVRKVFPPGYRYIIATYEDKYIRASYFVRDFKKLAKISMEKLKEESHWYQENIERFEETSRELRIFARELRGKEYENVEEWKEDFIRLAEKAIPPQSYGYFTEIFNITDEEYWLTKRIRESDKTLSDEEVRILTASSHPSFLKKYEIMLEKTPEEELDKVLDKYYWVKGSYYKTPLLTIEDLKEDKKESDPKWDKNVTRKKKEIIGENEELQSIIEFMDACIKMQDERKGNTLITNYAVDRMAEKLSELIEWEKEQILSLTPLELLSILEGKEINDLKENLKKRNERSAWICKQEGYFISSEEKAWNEVSSLLKKESSDKLQGTPACKGVASGKAKIITSEDDFPKFEKGDILITSMTRPEFVPVMKKAAAIITDEGGVTCHAAIVSRELDKPCIVGTQSATEAFKDYDILKVDADKGVVKKVE